MKLPVFEYACPNSLVEALDLLSAADGQAKLVSGGQSLMPILAFRLAAPTLLVDIQKIPDLDRIAIAADGVHLGARVRWRDIEADRRLADAHPLLAEAISHVAHYQIRNRGTVGGSLAHADPAAEMPGIAVTCDAELILAGPAGERRLPAREFFLGILTTALDPTELIVGIHLPPWRTDRHWGFAEVARRRGDFAMAGIAAFYDAAEGQATNVHIGAIGVGHTPLRLAAAEAALEGHAVTAETIAQAAQAAAKSVDPPDDIHASAAYRKALIEALVERTLRKAAGLTSSSRT